MHLSSSLSTIIFCFHQIEDKFWALGHIPLKTESSGAPPTIGAAMSELLSNSTRPPPKPFQFDFEFRVALLATPRANGVCEWGRRILRRGEGRSGREPRRREKKQRSNNDKASQYAKKVNQTPRTKIVAGSPWPFRDARRGSRLLPLRGFSLQKK